MSLNLDLPYHSSESLLFCFKDQKLFVKKEEDRVLIPSGKDILQLKIEHSRPFFIGSLNHRPCFCAQADVLVSEHRHFGLHGLRELFEHLSQKLFKMASLGLQFNNWDQVSTFCGKCGYRLHMMKTECAKKCLSCGHVEYHRISPAVIMAVTRGHEILLARPKRIKSGFYSVLAGYVEFGETLEECVEREIQEEVGLSVRNVRYFGSQSWPFTNSLMIAFTTEYASGKIRIQKSEIIDAAWFTPDNLPPLPGWGSISRCLVDSFVKMNAD
ncbi:MAG: NAD(+) diphosphatase [Desulfobacterales bacterium]